MTQFQAVIDQAVTNGAAPFLVAGVADHEGVRWMGHAGEVARDAVFCIFSMTKAVGTLAAIILVERGLLDLDTPVADIAPQFGRLKLLTGFDGDRPVLRAPATQATIRQLITHQSGLQYEHWNADVLRWMKATDSPNMRSGKRAGLNYPLTFEPGTSWGYGLGIDWLGVVIEAVSGRTPKEFCHDEIFAPLQMHNTTFDPPAEMARMYYRTEAGFADNPLSPPVRPEFYGMGQCLYSTPADYLRLLRMFLRGGALDGTRILGRDGAAMMQTPQTGPLPHPLMRTANPKGSADFDPFPDTPCSHTLGFLRVNQDVPGMRRAGSLGWAGFANTHYWIDPASDIAAVFMTQLTPFGDPALMAAYGDFERAVYAL